MASFDIVIIGGGSAGYVAAIRCAQLGFSTACVDEYLGKDGGFALGGTCVNAGCVSSKALLDSSSKYHRLKYRLANHGISVEGVGLDLHQMVSRKDNIVRNLAQNIESQFKKHNVSWYKGHGSLVDPIHIKITPPEGMGPEETIKGSNIILATGSSPNDLPTVKVDGNKILDSAHALDFQEVPKRLGIIGSGVIGVELGSVWKRLGSEVVLLEAMDKFLSFTDEEIAAYAHGTFTSQGLEIHMNARVISAKANDRLVSVNYEDDDGHHTLEVDKLLVAVGRRPHTEGLNLDDIGVLTDEAGDILVDAHCRTNVPHIYAIGDVVRGPMLAHKGSEEGIMVAERLAGAQTSVNYDAIPWVIYTSPEIAWVGETEKELKAGAREYKIGRFSLKSNIRALAMDDHEGMVKLISDKQTDEILGVHIIAPTASELVAEAVVAMEYNASAEDIARIVHAHPTLAESIREAALAIDGRSIHG